MGKIIKIREVGELVLNKMSEEVNYSSGCQKSYR